MTKSRGILPPRIIWTDDQVEILRARYPFEKTELIADSLGMNLRHVYQKANRLGLHKSPEYLATPASGRTNGRQGVGTRFEKGITPWNKGSNFAAGGRSPETRFKPGTAPVEVQPVAKTEIWGKGITEGPNDCDFYTACIDIEEHGAAVEFHSTNKQLAEQRRDLVLSLRDPAALTAAGFATVEDLLAAYQVAQKDIHRLETGIKCALLWANNRQSEWGDRAENAFEFLECALLSSAVPEDRDLREMWAKVYKVTAAAPASEAKP